MHNFHIRIYTVLIVIHADTTKGGSAPSTPKKQTPVVFDMFSPIEKLQWLNVEGLVILVILVP